jgi:hypothetical protein
VKPRLAFGLQMMEHAVFIDMTLRCPTFPEDHDNRGGYRTAKAYHGTNNCSRRLIHKPILGFVRAKYMLRAKQHKVVKSFQEALKARNAQPTLSAAPSDLSRRGFFLSASAAVVDLFFNLRGLRDR